MSIGNRRSRASWKSGNATSVGALALALIASPAMAAPAQQTQAPDVATGAQEQAASERDIVVTGTRITANGYNAPTPTTVIGEEQIQANAQPNIFNTVAQLPSLQGSTGATTGTFSTSSGQQGLSSFRCAASVPSAP
ncbi:hypothetical protein GCM10020258_39830 [Sphingomonas yabuuchiae]